MITRSSLTRRLCAILAACCLGAPPALAQHPRAVAPTIDDQGHVLRLPAPAQRLITLTPHATELVFAAGGGERIVGTVEHSDYPPAARAIPRVGDVWQINPETVLALRPDLLVAWLAGSTHALNATLQTTGIPVFFSMPARLADIPDNIEKLGVLMRTEDVAQPAARELRRRLAALEARYAHRQAVTVFVQAGSHPLYTLTDKHIVGDVLRHCGAVNIYARSGPLAPIVDIEAVIEARPQAIVTSNRQGETEASAFWQRYAAALPAVAQGHVFVLDPDALYRPGPRLIDAAEQLCEMLEGVRRNSPTAR